MLMVVWKVQTSVDRVRERLHCKSFAQKKNENFVQGIFADAECTYDFFLCFGAFTRELTLLTFSSYFPVHSLRSLPLSPFPCYSLLISSFSSCYHQPSSSISLFHPPPMQHIWKRILCTSARVSKKFSICCEQNNWQWTESCVVE